MSRTSRNILRLVVVFISVVTASAETWTSKNGKAIEAEAILWDFERDKVQFALKNGRRAVVPISSLTEESQAQLKALQAKQEAALTTGVLHTRHPPGYEKFTYHYKLPASFKPDNKTPILILFSPGGNGKSIMKKFQAASEKHGWTLLGCDGLKNGMGWTSEEREAFYDALFADIERTIPHHPYRIYMGGMSGGALRAYQISRVYPEKPFAGIIACGGWHGGFFDADMAKHMAVAICNGDNDKNANAWMRKDREYMEKYDARVKEFSFPGGHVLPPESRVADVFRWLEEDWKTEGMAQALNKMKRTPR